MSKYYTSWLKQEDYPQWNTFLEGRRMAAFFHQIPYLQKLGELLKLKFSVLAVYNSNNELVAGFPHLYARKWGMPYVYTPPVTTVYAPLIIPRESKYRSKRESHDHEIAQTLYTTLVNTYRLQKLVFPVGADDLRPCKQVGYRVKPAYTYTATLAPGKDLLAGATPSLKRQIKKAAKRYYQINRTLNSANIQVFYQLQEKAFKRQGMAFPFSAAQFEDLVRTMEQLNGARIATIYDHDQPAASLIFAVFKHKVWYLFSGADPDKHNTGLNQLLLAEELHALAHQGYTWFDFVGANTPSISRYKSLYNFHLKPYFIAEHAKGIMPKAFTLLK